jgi:hypothetical protein
MQDRGTEDRKIRDRKMDTTGVIDASSMALAT